MIKSILIFKLMGYSEKYQTFVKMCNEAKDHDAEFVLIHHAQVIGDNYEEIIENLNRLADADLMLRIVSRESRGERS